MKIWDKEDKKQRFLATFKRDAKIKDELCTAKRSRVYGVLPPVFLLQI